MQVSPTSHDWGTIMAAGVSQLVHLAAYITAGATLGLFLVAAVTLTLAWWRFRRETLSVSVTAEHGGVSGEDYHETGFQVCLINKGTQDVVVYSAGYHVNDDKDNRNFQFNDEYIYHRPAKEGDKGAVPKLEFPSGDYESYAPDSPLQTIHSEVMFPIHLPPGGIYTGLWPVTIMRHRNHLLRLQDHVLSDYVGLRPVMKNHIPYIFLSTIHGTKKIKIRPYGRWVALARISRWAVYQVSRVPPFGLLRRFLFSSESGFGYWADRRIKATNKRNRFFFPPSSYERGIYPMSAEENQYRKRLPDSLGLSDFHQVKKHVSQIVEKDSYIEVAGYVFEITTSHGFRYGLLSATTARPPGYSSHNVQSFLRLNMLLGLEESWAYPQIETVRRETCDGQSAIYDTRHYFIPHDIHN